MTPDKVGILLVTATGCHFCEEAKEILDELSQKTPLNIRTVPLNSDEGRSLTVQFRVPFPPILLVDGAFFGYGRISSRKLGRLLAAPADVAPVA